MRKCGIWVRARAEKHSGCAAPSGVVASPARRRARVFSERSFEQAYLRVRRARVFAAVPERCEGVCGELEERVLARLDAQADGALHRLVSI